MTTTRRSTRARGRENVESEAQGGATVSIDRPTKRARPNASRHTAEDTKKTAQETDEWIHTLLTPDNRSAWDAFLKSHFHLNQPTDLFDLFELAAHLAPNEPLEAFVSTAGIRLAGPFDLLARSGSSVKHTKPFYLHGRFFYDPPEVVTVAHDVDSKTGAHWGLYRDKPRDPPGYVVYAEDARECSFELVATNLFAVLHARLEERKSSSAAKAQLRLVKSYMDNRSITPIKSAAALHSLRASECIAKPLNGLGIVVPYDTKKRSGFRELPIVGEHLRDVLTNARAGDAHSKKKLTNLITRATIANDECDFGTSLLLGLDLFTAGVSLQKESLQMLRVAYMLLGRKEFAKVASDHVKHRVDGLVPLESLTESSTDAATLGLP